MITELSPSAEALLQKFIKEHDIRTGVMGGEYYARMSQRRYFSDRIWLEWGKTRLEAVRKVCKKRGILCEL